MLSSFFKKTGKELFLNKGTVIVDCNDEVPSGIFFLKKGFVKAFSLSERGREHVHIIYKAGEIFPARWAFGATKGGLTYIAITDVEVLKVDKAALTDYLDKNPQELHEALSYINMILDIFVNRVNDLEHNIAYLRVAARLVSLAKRFGKAEDGGVLIEAPLTQQEIAASLSLTRESVSREMGKLIEKQIIEYHDQLLFIKDLNMLEKEIREYPE